MVTPQLSWPFEVCRALHEIITVITTHSQTKYANFRYLISAPDADVVDITFQIFKSRVILCSRGSSYLLDL